MPRTNNPIRKLPSGKWQVRYRDDKGKQRSKNVSSAREAAKVLREARVSIDGGTYIAPGAGKELFLDFAHRWADAQDWAVSTRESFGAHLRRLEPTLGGLRVDQIDGLVLGKTRADLIQRYATSTATISFHYATTISRAAYHSGLIPRDPTIGLKPPKRRGSDADQGVGADQVPTRAEMISIINATPDPFRGAVVLGACGLRVGEVLGVTVDRLDLDGGTLLVDRQLQRQGGRLVFTRPKREKVRRIGLPSWAGLYLRRHLRDQGPFWSLAGSPAVEGLLFRGGRGAALNRSEFYESAWHPALTRAGLDRRAYVFHSLRHWCASSMLAAGAPITAVAGHLGDTVETVSRTYAHWLRDDREIPVLVLDGLLGPVSEGVG